MLVFLVLSQASRSRADEFPDWLPRYDLEMRVDVDRHRVHVRQRVKWTNRHQRPVTELVFNAHSHYQIPAADVGFMAKTLEILRMPAGDSIEDPSVSPPLEIKRISSSGEELAYHYQEVDIKDGFKPNKPLGQAGQMATGTALVVGLPAALGQGQAAELEIEFELRLPQKQGRWGQWKGVTFLATWLPVVAVHDDSGWQPTPFIPWHQPFFNEAGIYSARISLPKDQKIACSAPVLSVRDAGQGWQQVDFTPVCVRDFAFLCSANYQEFTAKAGSVEVRCLAVPGHEHYAQLMVRWVCEALPIYTRWFGPYPYTQFTIAESYFGWNGNECSGLVMIDERIFNMPRIAGNFVEYLVSHEFLHQWWYNVVGTNGYAETWMDEGLTTFFSHRLMDKKQGRNSSLLTYPKFIEWLPNIHRENYRNASLMGAIGRGDTMRTVQNIPEYRHLVNLLSMCYDRGGRVVGIIEERLGGETAFLDFMRTVYRKYQFRILRVADFKRELEAYTGRSWDEFFDNWVYGAEMTDWAVEDVNVKPLYGREAGEGLAPVELLPANSRPGHGYHATILLKQKSTFSDETVLGISLDGSEDYQIRIPIQPHLQTLQIQDPPARIETLSDNSVRVEVDLPARPTQISVDPDQVLVDPNRANNHWKPKFRVRWAPLYTPLEETTVTNDYDRWNINFGLGGWHQAFNDPWYIRSAMAGARFDAYRTEFFNGSLFTGYRANDRALVAGAEAVIHHWPADDMQLGLHFDRRLDTIGADGDRNGSRGVVYFRKIFGYGSSLYLPPMHYVEQFSSVLDQSLLQPRHFMPGAEQYDRQTNIGLHYHLDYLTPYWDPEGGYRIDATYTSGIPIFGQHQPSNRLDGQFSIVKGLPDGLGYLSDTRLAARVYAGAGLPTKGQYYALGGGDFFRGFDQRERQGNLVWLASLEWRLPVVRRVNWDCFDHIVGVRNVYLAPFYDVGDAYVRGQSFGPTAHALGMGLRIDVAWLSLIERTTLRVDVARAIGTESPWQLWIGLMHPF